MDDADMAAGRADVQAPNKSDIEQKKVLTASFRGRPLQGRKVNLPTGFKGCLVSRDGKISEKFNDFTYWNWDQLPKDDDKVVQAMKWLNLSEALSS